MSEIINRTGFFDNGEYGQEEWSRFIGHAFDGGVAVEDSGELGFVCTNMRTKLKIDPGYIVIGAYYLDIVEAMSLTPTATVKYRLVAKLDLVAKAVTLYLKEGTSSAPPDLTNTATVKEKSLYQFANTSSGITGIIDERWNESLCGTFRPKYLAGYKAMMVEFNRRFEAYMDGIQGIAPRPIYIQEAEPENPVEGAIWI